MIFEKYGIYGGGVIEKCFEGRLLNKKQTISYYQNLKNGERKTQIVIKKSVSSKRTKLQFKIPKLSPIQKRYSSTAFVITLDRIWSTTILIYKTRVRK